MDDLMVHVRHIKLLKNMLPPGFEPRSMLRNTYYHSVNH